MQLTVYSPAGVVLQGAPLRRAVRNLRGLGFDAALDEAALHKHQRFAGDDAQRLAAIHRVAASGVEIALAARGGYGLTRLLGALDWPLLTRSVAEHGTRWVGYSDLTALQLGLLAHGGAGSWAGPCAIDDFSREGELDEVTVGCFQEAMRGELEAVGWRTGPGLDGLDLQGRLWGGNLAMVCSLLGTPHWPRIRGGLLFLEEVNEQPYRIERALLQLQQAGVLEQQRAVLLGAFTLPAAKSPLDRGFSMKTIVERLRSSTRTPILTGLPFGHVSTKLCLPVGRRARLFVEGRNALLGW